MLNRDFVERKCNLIVRDLELLGSLSVYPFEEVAADFTKFSTVERLLEKIVTRAIDINRHIIAEKGDGNEKVRGYEDTFYALAKIGVLDGDFAKKIAPTAGLRNRLVYEYDDTDPEIIFNSIKDALKYYTMYCEAILKFAEEKMNGDLKEESYT